MYQLIIVSGPNTGTTYVIPMGDFSIGRQSGNAIILSSSKVSKLHCTVTVIGEEVTVRDEGSANGTFVNGSLIRTKQLREGDRISVGNFVLELTTQVRKSTRAIALPRDLQNLGNPSLSPSMSSEGVPHVFSQVPEFSSVPSLGDGLATNAPPKDLRSKILWAFENQFMPIFYGLNLSYEWRVLGVALAGVFLFLNVSVSVYPLLQSSHEAVIREMGQRALFMARQIAEQNTRLLASHMEVKTEIGIVEHTEGVKGAYLLDMDNRIIAPGVKLNQYLLTNPEANVAVKAKNRLRAREDGYWVEADESTIVAIEPVKVYSPQAGKNVIIAIALVALDSSLATPELGELGVIYSEILGLTGIILGILMLIFYRITLKPFDVLNEDIDKALKGEMRQVTHEFKFEELNSLWDIINAAMQRAVRNNQTEKALDTHDYSGEFMGPLRMIGNLTKFGMIAFDSQKRILMINSVFEDMTGIRSDSAIGQDIFNVARDQAMASMTQDLLSRASPGMEGATEEFEFSGIPHKVYAAGFGPSGEGAKCYIMLTVKIE